MSDMKKVLFIVIIMPVILVGAVYVFARIGVEHSSGVACTEEAKVCPDGSSVSRTGLHCEFAACPNDILPKNTEPEPTPGQKVTQVGFNQSITDNDIRMTPLTLVTDSRCAKDVTCIAAGTVTITLQLKKEGETRVVTLSLGQSVLFGSRNVQFASVSPQKYSKVVITPEEYRFEFLVASGN